MEDSGILKAACKTLFLPIFSSAQGCLCEYLWVFLKKYNACNSLLGSYLTLLSSEKEN